MSKPKKDETVFDYIERQKNEPNNLGIAMKDLMNPPNTESDKSIDEILKAYASSMSLNEQLFQAGENSKKTRDIDDEVSMNRAKALLLAEILKGLPKKKLESSKAWEYFGYTFSTHDDKLAFNSAIDETTQYIEQLFNVEEK